MTVENGIHSTVTHTDARAHTLTHSPCIVYGATLKSVSRLSHLSAPLNPPPPPFSPEYRVHLRVVLWEAERRRSGPGHTQNQHSLHREEPEETRELSAHRHFQRNIQDSWKKEMKDESRAVLTAKTSGDPSRL